MDYSFFAENIPITNDNSSSDGLVEDGMRWQLVPFRRYRNLQKRLVALDDDYTLAEFDISLSPSGSLPALDVTKTSLEKSARWVKFLLSLPHVDSGAKGDFGGLSGRLSGAKRSLNAVDAYLAWIAGELSNGADDLARLLTGVEGWYLHGDVTALKYVELDEAFQRRPVTDAERWCQHLRALLPSTAQKCTPTDEQSSHHAHYLHVPITWAPPTPFIQKVIRLVQELLPLSQDGGKKAFHTLVFIVAQRWTARTTRLSGAYLYRDASESPTDAIRETLMGVLRQRSVSALRTLFPGGETSGEEATTLPFAYWDFAAAFRDLWTAFASYDCRVR